MDFIEPQAIKVIMTATGPHGDKLALVEYPNNGCGLLRNGVPLLQMKWVPCHMKECTAALLRLRFNAG